MVHALVIQQAVYKDAKSILLSPPGCN